MRNSVTKMFDGGAASTRWVRLANFPVTNLYQLFRICWTQTWVICIQSVHGTCWRGERQHPSPRSTAESGLLDSVHRQHDAVRRWSGTSHAQTRRHSEIRRGPTGTALTPIARLHRGVRRQHGNTDSRVIAIDRDVTGAAAGRENSTVIRPSTLRRDAREDRHRLRCWHCRACHRIKHRSFGLFCSVVQWQLSGISPRSPVAAVDVARAVLANCDDVAVIQGGGSSSS